MSALGPGATVMTGGVLSNNLEIGPHALVNITATIGHDWRIGAFSLS
jgi:UDP-3-O-[3-hydroxymyristoyl] glucosamine N-acyltransferase